MIFFSPTAGPSIITRDGVCVSFFFFFNTFSSIYNHIIMIMDKLLSFTVTTSSVANAQHRHLKYFAILIIKISYCVAFSTTMMRPRRLVIPETRLIPRQRLTSCSFVAVIEPEPNGGRGRRSITVVENRSTPRPSSRIHRVRYHCRYSSR